MIKKFKSICLMSAAAIAVLGTLSSIGNTQTLFEKPDTTPDYSRYATAEECLSAIQRLAGKARRSMTYWTDTVKYTTESQLASFPEEASAVAGQCIEKFSVDSIPLAEAQYWAEVYLLANLDAQVEKLYLRKYADATDSARMEIFVEHINLYRRARPIRFELIKDLSAVAIAEIPSDSTLWLTGLYSMLMQVGQDVGDIEFTLDMASRVIDVYNSAPPSAFESENNANIMKGLVLQATYFYKEAEIMDSLAVSTEAYRQLRAAQAAEYVDLSLLQMGIPAGIEAPGIIADHWYQYNNEQPGSYTKIDSFTSPVADSVNVIVFLHPGCHEAGISSTTGRANPGDGSCWIGYAALKRISQDYPDVKLTIVTNTHGSLGRGAPLSPAEEADTLAAYFLGFHRLPATLAVVDRPNFRLPGLDRRRIDTETENEVNYQIGFSSSIATFGNAIIIDRDGKVVEIAMPVHIRKAELHIRQFIEAVLAQNKTK